MFKKELCAFKNKVVEEMDLFFKMTPEQVSNELNEMKNKYDAFCHFDSCDLKELSNEYKDIVVKYKTLLYFNGIYERLVDLENFFNEGVVNDGTEIC